VTDFSSLVSKIGDDIDVVYLPWQIAANAQIFGQQMKEQGKKAVIFGSDGLDSGDFKITGSYVSAFAPDIRGIAGNAAFIKGTGRSSSRTSARPRTWPRRQPWGRS
jgi:ABC-type branched-subunit amino acid transport system substrate-binding protein